MSNAPDIVEIRLHPWVRWMYLGIGLAPLLASLGLLALSPAAPSAWMATAASMLALAVLVARAQTGWRLSAEHLERVWPALRIEIRPGAGVVGP